MKQALKMLAIFAMTMMIMHGCECEKPLITSVTPPSGAGGTIVEVKYSKGSIDGDMYWEGTKLETRNASILGLGNTLYFTVPVGATNAGHAIKVSSGGKFSDDTTFTVTGPGAHAIPQIHGFDICHGIKELTLYGANFTTNSIAILDGTDTVKQYAGGSMPLRIIPHNFVDNILLMTLPGALTMGSAHTITVVNSPAHVSANFAFTVPNRLTKMEYSMATGGSYPQYYIERLNSVYSLRRAYCDAGMIIDITIGDSVAKPAVGGASGGFTDADLYSFWQAYADTTDSGWYMMGVFVDAYDDAPGWITWGSMFMNRKYSLATLPTKYERRGYALFRNGFTAAYFGSWIEEAYLRDVCHEAGHGFNLYHADTVGMYSTSIMTRNANLDSTNWILRFSAASRTHLQSHSVNDVKPGKTAFDNRTCH